MEIGSWQRQDTTLIDGIRKHYSNITSAINSLTQANERLKINRDLTLENLRVDILEALDEQGNAAVKGYTGLDKLSKQLFALAEEGQRVTQEQKVLESLIFEEMEQRGEAIKDAQSATLDWMFRENGTRFMNWLKAETGIYWVKGKVRDPPSKLKGSLTKF